MLVLLRHSAGRDLLSLGSCPIHALDAKYPIEQCQVVYLVWLGRAVRIGFHRPSGRFHRLRSVVLELLFFGFEIGKVFLESAIIRGQC